MPRGCVFGCQSNTQDPIHTFPNPKRNAEIFRQWVELLVEPERSLPDAEIYRRKRVCNRHFVDKDHNRNHRLNALAVPSLYLPNNVNGAVKQTELDTHDNPSGEDPLGVNSSGGEESCEIPIKDSLGDNTSNEVHTDILQFAMQQIDLDVSTVSTSQILDSMGDNPLNDDPSDFYLLVRADDTPNVPSSQHTSNTSNPIQKRLIESKKEIRRWKQKAHRLKKRCEYLKTRLKTVTRLSDSIALQRISRKVSPTAMLLINMQFRENAKKPNGHRFKSSEKIMALALYKRSPECYAMLSEYLTLPTERTLQKMLS
ncbi:uncharacterized protein LOC112051000 isoform X2 [Bicyclus anynana]|uniref:Uncharacterized protein LOC112051000 isoform X2 n=1 Tax=Bicyclus anynana TaxID=110368 RepID=A0ABM3M3T7_BICAN|nr:uncharacterized protein LOC112051000 isoform X2 [Bicyclus anynana]